MNLRWIRHIHLRYDQDQCLLRSDVLLCPRRPDLQESTDSHLSQRRRRNRIPLFFDRGPLWLPMALRSRSERREMGKSLKA